MREARRNLSVRFEHATTDRLRTLVTLGQCCGMHYSGHGDPNFLSMEDGRGNAHFVHVPALKKLLQAGSLSSLRFVFVSACYSEAAATAFVEAGVPHVIAVRITTRVSDKAAHAFTRAFYLALAMGQTIKESFDIGVQAVATAPNVPEGEVEGGKFLLLGSGAHDEAPFPSLGVVEAWQPPPPAGRGQGPLPALAECFLGRNVETYCVIKAILDRRLVSVTGAHGVGKSAVAVSAINYLAERHYYSDGVVYVDCGGVGDVAGLAAPIRACLDKQGWRPRRRRALRRRAAEEVERQQGLQEEAPAAEETPVAVAAAEALTLWRRWHSHGHRPSAGAPLLVGAGRSCG